MSNSPPPPPPNNNSDFDFINENPIHSSSSTLNINFQFIIEDPMNQVNQPPTNKIYLSGNERTDRQKTASEARRKPRPTHAMSCLKGNERTDRQKAASKKCSEYYVGTNRTNKQKEASKKHGEKLKSYKGENRTERQKEADKKRRGLNGENRTERQKEADKKCHKRKRKNRTEKQKAADLAHRDVRYTFTGDELKKRIPAPPELSFDDWKKLQTPYRSDTNTLSEKAIVRAKHIHEYVTKNLTEKERIQRKKTHQNDRANLEKYYFDPDKNTYTNNDTIAKLTKALNEIDLIEEKNKSGRSTFYLNKPDVPDPFDNLFNTHNLVELKQNLSKVNEIRQKIAEKLKKDITMSNHNFDNLTNEIPDIFAACRYEEDRQLNNEHKEEKAKELKDKIEKHKQYNLNKINEAKQKLAALKK
jgi:hypothetical protein